MAFCEISSAQTQKSEKHMKTLSVFHGWKHSTSTYAKNILLTIKRRLGRFSTSVIILGICRTANVTAQRGYRGTSGCTQKCAIWCWCGVQSGLKRESVSEVENRPYVHAIILGRNSDSCCCIATCNLSPYLWPCTKYAFTTFRIRFLRSLVSRVCRLSVLVLDIK